MPRKLRELRADLRRSGARISHQSGSHEKWQHILVPDLNVELAGKDGADARPYQERQVRELLQRIAHVRRREQP